MKKPDHDSYHLVMAAKKFKCSVEDFLQWGAEGKISLYAWHAGLLYVHNETGDGMVKSIKISEAVEIPSDKIRDVLIYKSIYEKYNPPRRMSITTSSGEAGVIDIAHGPNDLFVKTKELKAFFATQDTSQEDRLAKILDQTHPWHSENLAMAVNAWLELYAGREGKRHDSTFKLPGGNKELINDWLKQKNPTIGPTTQEHFRVIINPDKRGGPGKSSK